MASSSESCAAGFKMKKKCITALVFQCHRLPLTVTGKSKKPRAIKQFEFRFVLSIFHKGMDDTRYFQKIVTECVVLQFKGDLKDKNLLKKAFLWK